MNILRNILVEIKGIGEPEEIQINRWGTHKIILGVANPDIRDVTDYRCIAIAHGA
jgi:hypothetical protein